LKNARPDWSLSAVDASADALQVAQANAQRLGLALTWLHGDWFKPVSGVFDLIVSNPPYIAEQDPHLPALHAEPRQALVSGADGLEAIRHIIAQAPPQLKLGGWLLLEHGFDQAAKVQALLRQAGFGQVQSRKDLAGIQRCTGGQWLEVK
jgi:release factor glutamine methyltransferase